MPVIIRRKKASLFDRGFAFLMVVAVPSLFLYCTLWVFREGDTPLFALLPLGLFLIFVLIAALVWTEYRRYRMPMFLGRRSFCHGEASTSRRIPLSRVKQIAWGQANGAIGIEIGGPFPDRFFVEDAYFEADDYGRLVRWLREAFPPSIQDHWDEYYYHRWYEPHPELAEEEQYFRWQDAKFRARCRAAQWWIFFGMLVLIFLGFPFIGFAFTVIALSGGMMTLVALVTTASEARWENQNLLRRLPGPNGLDWLAAFALTLPGTFFPYWFRGSGLSFVAFLAFVTFVVLLVAVYCCRRSQKRLMEEIEMLQIVPRMLQRPVPPELAQFESIAERLEAGRREKPSREASP